MQNNNKKTTTKQTYFVLESEIPTQIYKCDEL